MLRRYLDKVWRAWRTSRLAELDAHLSTCPPDDPRYQKWAKAAIANMIVLVAIWGALDILSPPDLEIWKTGWSVPFVMAAVYLTMKAAHFLAMEHVLREEVKELHEKKRNAEGTPAEAGALEDASRSRDGDRGRLEGDNGSDDDAAAVTDGDGED